MYYLELIQRLWLFNERNHLGATAISVYLYLLKTGYKDSRYDFSLSDVAISKDLGLTRRTVKSIKEKLCSFGLIKCQTRNGLPGSYRLILDYPVPASDEKVLEKPLGIIRPSPAAGEVYSNRIIPPLPDFCAYAQTLQGYSPQLDFILKEKYEHWVRKGWKNNSSRPITDWKSTLKSTLPFLKNATEISNLDLTRIPTVKHPNSEMET